MRFIVRFVGVVLAVMACLVPASSAAAGARGGPAQNTVVRADLITDAHPLGWRVVAVAIEYRDTINVGAADIPVSAFTVAATVNNATANRTVTDVYTSDVPELDRRGPRGTPGRYLIIELSPDDPNAGALVYAMGRNEPVPLVGAYAVRQTANVVDDRGRVLLRASPFTITNQGVINPIVDDFVSLSYSDSAGTPLKFRLFQPQARPDRRRDGFPLVVFLHGGGERGANNISQITANQGAVAFAKPERQASDPSYVLAAQVPVGSSWTTPAVQAALIELIDTLVATLPIDEDRLYLTGLSLGGIGSFDILPKLPRQVRRSAADRLDRRRQPDAADGRRAGVGDALHRRSDRQLHHRHARADQRAGGGGRAGRPGRMARQPARPRGRGRGAAPVGAGRRQGQPHVAHDVHGGHDPRQRALVVGADLPQRRHDRLAL